MKKNILRKNAFVEITKSKSRFFSIFGIVAIGVAFFTGVKNAAPDMRLSADNYYKNENLSHYRLVSTLGFSDSDISALENINGINVYPAYFTDALIKRENGEDAVKVMSLEALGENNVVNKLALKEGRFPTADNECIADAGSLMVSINVGDKITLVSGTDADISETLKESEYTVVGLYDSPMYIDKSSRGNTTVGNGTIKNVIYINKDNFLSEVYTEVYITADELNGLNAYTAEFDDKSDEIMTTLEQVGENREIERYDEILAEANAKITDAEKELEDKKAEADKELTDAKTQLEDALLQITDGEKQLEDAKVQLAEAKNDLAAARTELDDGYKSLEAAKRELYDKTSKAEVELTQNEQLLNEQETAYNESLKQYNAAYAEFETNFNALTMAQEEYTAATQLYGVYKSFYNGEITLEQLIAALTASADDTDAQDEEILAEEPFTLLTQEEVAALGEQVEVSRVSIAENETTLAAVKQQLDATKVQLDAAKVQLDDGFAQLNAAKTELENTKTTSQAQLDASEKELGDNEIKYQNGVDAYKQNELAFAQSTADLEKAKDDYEKGLEDYTKAKSEADEKIADAEKKIRSAKRDVSKLENPTWYVFDRSANVGYSEYGNNADRINNIASVFPVFFILVAALVCLTTMTRMVDEQRIQIGTLKALGYKNGQIVFKYLLYALLATISGALAGTIIGQELFPAAIIGAYGMLYSIPDILTPLNWALGGVTILVSAAAVSLTVYASCRSVLAECPAQLMRPKAPRIGKRILLEHLPFWKKVSFNGKVTARNIFRYKRRMLMTVIGVAGCTALTLTGFALRDSINGIVEKQFTELNHYDGVLQFESNDETEISDIKAALNENGTSLEYYQKKMTVKQNGVTVSAYIFVPRDSAAIVDYYTLRDRKTHEPYTLRDTGVIIDEKMSLMLGVSAGDSITVYKTETEPSEVTVTAITENYPNHYVYMTEALYNEIFGALPEYNMFAFAMDDAQNVDAQNKLAETLLSLDGVLGVSYSSEISNTFETMLKALDSIIWILLASAGALAFVVLYNLTNINITERIREIATLKVLGYYDGEVDGYVFRENLVLTLMGTAVGLFGGKFLADFIIKTAEIDLVMFGRDISALSYILSAILTIVFSLLVSLYMHRRLKRVDMIEALKSVE